MMTRRSRVTTMVKAAPDREWPWDRPCGELIKPQTCLGDSLDQPRARFGPNWAPIDAIQSGRQKDLAMRPKNETAAAAGADKGLRGRTRCWLGGSCIIEPHGPE